MARVNDARQVIEIAADKETVKNGPTFDDDREITPEFENQVYSYYGRQHASTIEESGTYGAYYAEQTTQTTGVADRTDVSHEDEVRVQRAEEELRVGTRERKAGSIRIRKRVRTDREHIEVPTRHEEVTVERVPVEGEASEIEIGEDEVRVPVTEEEVVVQKRPVVKEEVRIRKDVVEETEVVEEDVRREEIEVEDDTERRGGL
jgi:uncharacterized protein (TIGR02271 family)